MNNAIIVGHLAGTVHLHNGDIAAVLIITALVNLVFWALKKKG